MENGDAVFILFHNPGCGCWVCLIGHGRGSRAVAWCVGHALAELFGFGVESDEQLVGQGDADDFGRFAGCGEALPEGDEVGFVAADDASHGMTFVWVGEF
jgi:hypothetical protein